MTSQDELKKLLDLLEEARRGQEEERRAREEAERQIQPTTLSDYLERCHHFSLALRIETNPTKTTQGEPANPVNKVYPKRILHWHDFSAQQEEVWERFYAEPTFLAQRLFASLHQLDYVQDKIRTISAEMGLRQYESDTVEDHVRSVVEKLYGNEVLRLQFGLRGTVTFESHANLGESSVEESLEGAMEQVAIAEPAEVGPGGVTFNGKGKAKITDQGRVRARGSRADQFCVYRLADEKHIPAFTIEYKAPHKLTLNSIVVGLHELEPDRDVIDRDGEGFAFHSTRLVAAVITQIFFYMVKTGVQYGYVCTGEAFIFLYIPDDPSTIKYHLCVPNADVKDDDEHRLHQTAVAQVLAFSLRALAARPPSQSWHDTAAGLNKWNVEYSDVLRDIPESIRKEHPPSLYRPPSWKPVRRSPILLRSGCRPIESD